MGKPPRSPHSTPPSSSRASTSTSSSRKSRKRSSNDSPSASATNEHGRESVEKQLRSLLCHPLGLPLLCSFHGRDPSKLNYLHLKRLEWEPGHDGEACALLSKAVEHCTGEKGLKEKELTTTISEKINALSFANFHARPEIELKEQNLKYGNIDILLTTNESLDSPYALIEFGLHNNDWWKKVDQNVKYLDKIALGHQEVKFHKPILFAAVTLEDRRDGDGSQTNFPFKIGVFLCTPKEEEVRNSFRMSLLWQATAADLTQASKLFGRFLRVTHDFCKWRDVPAKEDEFKYLSSNCCKVRSKDEKTYMVLRSYDNRVWETNRNPQIYLKCPDVVGETETVLDLSSGDIDSHLVDIGENESFWRKTKGTEEKRLLILATPFRDGEHFASKPTSFIPIVQHLRALHEEGYVHGDIRAFNTIFASNPAHGWLIDFDFGGEEGTQRFPEGYKTHLPDGIRLGGEKEKLDNKEKEDKKPPAMQKIEKYHDWFALGQLMFQVHTFKISALTELSQEEQISFFKLEKIWMGLKSSPTPEDVKALESALKKFEQCPVAPSLAFERELGKFS